MRRAIVEYIPDRYLPLAALAAGRPDAASVHLVGHGESTAAGVAELLDEVSNLRDDVARLRLELSAAMDTIAGLRADASSS